MRLREYFADKKDEDDDVPAKFESKLKKKSEWTPPEGRDKWLDLYLDSVKEDVIRGIKRQHNMNISTAEAKAMTDLVKDTSIVIRPQDKGSGVVILNTESYNAQIEQELNDSTTYMEVDKDPTPSINSKIKRQVNRMARCGYIDNAMKKYLTVKDPKPGFVKANPKTHKPGNPPRTIISGIGHPTEKVAELAESELSEHVKSLPTYVKDTTDFLKKIQTINQPLQPGTILFCMDVKRLYPSVPRTEGLEACRAALTKRTDQTIPTEEILKVIDLVLKNNNFKFKDRHYMQTEGTAIGSRLGMNYACTYMGEWENTLLHESNQTPLAYWRFVDDIWGIWQHGEQSLLEFQTRANAIHPRITVELRYSDTEVEFLDTRTRLDAGNITTTVYEKPTDKHLYVRADSDHPRTVKQAIPYGLAIRAKRINSDQTTYVIDRNNIKSRLISRGHDPRQVEKELKKADKVDRKHLLDYRQKKQNERVPMVMTYQRQLPEVGRIIRDRMNILYKSDRLRTVFPEPSICAFKRNRNLQDILVHNKLRKNQQSGNTGTTKCGKKCAVCPYILETDCVEDKAGRKMTVRDRMSCGTTNMVYGVYCTQCSRYVYVGETGDTFYNRTANHLSSIRCRRDDVVPEHFRSKEHTIDSFRITGLEKIRKNSKFFRQQKEDWWMDRLGTVHPRGLNIQDTREVI
jgi:hypothetical protein